MTPVKCGTNVTWGGDATAKCIQYSFTLNKGKTIPAKRKPALLAAIQRLEGGLPADARVETDSSDGEAETGAGPVAEMMAVNSGDDSDV